jgi:hypothetical protein
MFSGISQHSTKRNLMIFSVFRNVLTHDQNFELHENLYRQFVINKKAFKEVEGFYKGEKELSFVTEYNFSLLNTILTEYRQESVLLLTNHKHGLHKATLVYKNKKEDLGFFRQVPKEIAIKQDSYTVDGKNYYICTKSDATTAEELIKLGLK